jgi:hypothetical protein
LGGHWSNSRSKALFQRDEFFMGAFDQGGWVVRTVDPNAVLWIQIGILVIMEKPFYFSGLDVEI